MSSRSSHPLEKPSRRARLPLALCTAAALGLNLAGLVAFAAVTTQWPEQKAPVLRAPSIVHVTVMQPRAAEFAQEARDLHVMPRATSPANVEAKPELDETSKTITSKPNSREPVPMLRFYASGEVDRPAEPANDWNLDTAALDSMRIDRLVFDLFIDASGDVLACVVLEPAGLDSDARRALEERIRQATTLRPATRSGVPVASVRRIEMTVLPAIE